MKFHCFQVEKKKVQMSCTDSLKKKLLVQSFTNRIFVFFLHSSHITGNVTGCAIFGKSKKEVILVRVAMLGVLDPCRIQVESCYLMLLDTEY